MTIWFPRTDGGAERRGRRTLTTLQEKETTSTRGMPRVRMGRRRSWHATKGLGERRRTQRSEGHRMGKPPDRQVWTVRHRAKPSPKRGTETSQYLRRESVSESRSSGERTGTSPNVRGVTGHTGAPHGLRACLVAYVDRHRLCAVDPKLLECSAPAGESPVGADARRPGQVPEYHGPRGRPWEAGRPTAQDSRPSVTDSAEYREGTVKSPPGGE